MTLSIIVPIYNVESYLKKCIESILAQTYKEFELILVDDGSPDNCGKICDEYAKQDNRIKVIHKKNGGLSSARNAGLDKATGEYISFIDGDDFIEKNMYERMLQYLNKYKADIVICEVNDVDEEDNILDKKVRYTSKEAELMDATEAMRRYLMGEWTASWDKLYKRELFNEIRFPEGKINEDVAIMLHIFEQTGRIVYIKEALYNYRQRANSITTSHFSIKKFDALENCVNNLQYIKDKHPELKNEAEYMLSNCILWLSQMIGRQADKGEYIEGVQEIKKLLRRQIISIYKNSILSNSTKVKLTLMMMSFKLYWRLKCLSARR